MSDFPIPDEIMPNVIDLMAMARKHVARYKGGDGSLPIFHIFKAGNEMEIVGAPIVAGSSKEADAAKDYVIGMIRAMCLRPEVQMVAFISEAWRIPFSNPEEVQQYLREKTAGKWDDKRHPKAQESLVLVVETPTFRMTGSAPIFTSTEDKTRVVGPIEWAKDHDLKISRMCNFFALRRKEGS